MVKFKWRIALFFFAMHVMAIICAPLYFSWGACVVVGVLHFLTGCLGMSIGYHRLLTHKSFQAPKWLEYTLAGLGLLALNGGAIKWVGDHRMHHKFSDTERDPHNSGRGFWWSHAGWLFFPDTDESIQWAPKEMRESRFHHFCGAHPLLPQIPLALVLYAIGGWPYVAYGIFVRIVFVWHCALLVNSATHKWGYRNYHLDDQSRNTWWVAALTYGEGWHENHHAEQWSANFSRRWWEIDICWWIIRGLEGMRLARRVLSSTEGPNLENAA